MSKESLRDRALMRLGVDIGLLAVIALFDLVSLLALIEHVGCLSCLLHDLVACFAACQHAAPLDVVDVKSVRDRLCFIGPSDIAQLDYLLAELTLSRDCHCLRCSLFFSRLTDCISLVIFLLLNNSSQPGGATVIYLLVSLPKTWPSSTYGLSVLVSLLLLK